MLFDAKDEDEYKFKCHSQHKNEDTTEDVVRKI